MCSPSLDTRLLANTDRLRSENRETLLHVRKGARTATTTEPVIIGNRL